MREGTSAHSKVALFDVCNTLVDHDTLGDFIENFFLSKERNPNIKFVTRARYFVWRFLRGRTHLLDSHSGREYSIGLLRGYSEHELDPLAQKYATYLMSCLKQPVVDDLTSLRDQGYELFLVSAGLELYLKYFTRSFGATLVSTVPEKNSNGFFIGKIDGPDCIGEGKVEKLKVVIDFDTIDWSNSVAFGDSRSDIPMLSLVGRATMVDPDPTLRAEAAARGWRTLTTTRSE